jgi:hypothetical protein
MYVLTEVIGNEWDRVFGPFENEVAAHDWADANPEVVWEYVVSELVDPEGIRPPGEVATPVEAR